MKNETKDLIGAAVAGLFVGAAAVAAICFMILVAVGLFALQGLIIGCGVYLVWNYGLVHAGIDPLAFQICFYLGCGLTLLSSLFRRSS